MFNWILATIQFASFVVLSNGSATSLFRPGCGLMQGFPLAPLLFILMMDGLSRMITKVASSGVFKGHRFDGNIHVSHIFFVDNLLFFIDGSRRDRLILKYSIRIFSQAIGMCCNNQKSTMSFLIMEQGMEQWYALSFDYILVNVESGISYLKFFIKPNDYAKKDWVWLLSRIENRLKMWCNRWVSHGGRLILINSILEAILVYWFSLSTVPSIILRIIRILCKNFFMGKHG